jgi:hypothetical protein
MHHRITVATYKRDMKIEKEMLEKCASANDWIEKAVKGFAESHDAYLA